ncbi:ATP-binding cassette domain-containing protein [Sandarakinorhabdus sp.]|uniref:ABC transporter ATP-binding protein n=1 Tax=Sandarakinorhabdus sp. TaxID=1916663 RepID=UPI00286E2BE6|nr:ATP-binding cassette domain-containing protein [Sandarakinorhabdus sp.]
MLVPTDIAFSPGTLTGLIGPNGAGKTTLLRALAGLSAGPGVVTLDGAPLRADPHRLGWLPADRDVAWPLKARDLVQLGLGPGAARDDTACMAALALTDAGGFADRAVDTLSTGERARVLLARALAARPAWLLLDEPVANLDPGHRLDVMAMLRGQAAGGVGVIAAMHDLDLAARCDRLVMMADGAVVADGPAAVVLADAALGDVFGVVRGQNGWERLRKAP